MPRYSLSLHHYYCLRGQNPNAIKNPYGNGVGIIGIFCGDLRSLQTVRCLKSPLDKNDVFPFPKGMPLDMTVYLFFMFLENIQVLKKNLSLQHHV